VTASSHVTLDCFGGVDVHDRVEEVGLAMLTAEILRRVYVRSRCEGKKKKKVGARRGICSAVSVNRKKEKENSPD
jgi:hypothetical protein